MLEKVPAAVGKALAGLKAGMEKAAYNADFATIPETVGVTSPAFSNGAVLPARFTEDGGKISPPLAWTDLPVETVTVAILAEDVDSPTPKPLVHLIIWNVPPATLELPEGGAPSQAAPNAGPEPGKNSFLKPGWLPPDPPTGHGPHRYLFQVYALDRRLDLPTVPGRGALVAAMRGHVLAKGSLVGTYERR